MAAYKQLEYISILDAWKGSAKPGRRYRVRVWCPSTNKNFVDKKWDDLSQGMEWAIDERRKMMLGYTRPKDVTLEDLANRYMKRLAKRGTAANHQQQVERLVKRLVKLGVNQPCAKHFCARVEQEILSMTCLPKTPQSSVNACVTEAGARHSVSTRNRHRGMVRAICRRGVLDGILERSPVGGLDLERPEHKVRQTFTVNEVSHLVDPMHGSDPWYLYALVLSYLGTRSTEGRHLQWGMIDWDARYVRLPHTLPGNKSRCDRYISIPDEAFAVLTEKRGEGRAPIVGEVINLLHRNSVNRGFSNYCNRCGVQCRRRGPHALRHTWNAVSIAMGENPTDVINQAGHTSNVIATHYAKESVLHRRDVQGWPRHQLQFMAFGSLRAVKTVQANLSESGATAGAHVL